MKCAEKALENVEIGGGRSNSDGSENSSEVSKEEKEFENARLQLQEKEAEYAKCEQHLSQIQILKVEIQEKAAQLSEVFESTQKIANSAETEVSIAMSLAEESVAMEVEAAQRVSDSEIALQKAEGSEKDAAQAAAVLAAVDIAEKLSLQVAKTAEVLLLETELKQEDEEEKENIAGLVDEKVIFVLFFFSVKYYCSLQFLQFYSTKLITLRLDLLSHLWNPLVEFCNSKYLGD